MSAELTGATDNDKLSCLGKRCYKDQGVWFLNAYFDKLGGEDLGEKVWTWATKFSELDKAKGAEGNELDEFAAHRFLESVGDTLSVRQMREALREIDLDFNKKVSLIEYIVYKFKADVTVSALVNASQGDKAEVDKALALLESAESALELSKTEAEAAKEAEAVASKSAKEAKVAEDEAAVSAEEAKVAQDKAEASEVAAKEAEAVSIKTEAEAVSTENTAKETETAAKEAEAVAEASDKAAKETEFVASKDAAAAASAASLATAADNENKRCLADLKREEDLYHGKIAKFETIVNDPASGIVKKNTAKNQLAQLKAEDPLPLRRAKISQSAAVRKSDIAAKNAVNSSVKAAATLQVATDARETAEKELALAVAARTEAEEALKAAVAARKEAAAALKLSVAARESAEADLAAAKEAKIEADGYHAAAVEAREGAEADLAASVAAREKANQAVEEAIVAFDAAAAYLTEVKSKIGSSQGALWWIDRDLVEARKYLPFRAGGIARK